jgi:hypothetical protein
MSMDIWSSRRKYVGISTMPRAKVVEFDYYQFLKLMQRARESGALIESGDPRWSPYIKQHAINEVTATVLAKQAFETALPVIIAEGHDTDGLYLYSKNEARCLRLVPIE